MKKKPSKEDIAFVQSYMRDDHHHLKEKQVMSTEKQLTPMQELIEWIENEILLNPQYKESPRFVQGAMTVKVKAQSLLPKEKQMVVEGYDSGVFNAKLRQTTLYTNGEEYFNKKYK